MGEFVEHLKRKAESAGCEVIELNAYKLKMSQYDPQTDTYRKKPLKERWHRWGNTDTLVQRDVMSAFLGSVRISVSGEVIPGAAQRGCPLYLRCSMPDLMR